MAKQKKKGANPLAGFLGGGPKDTLVLEFGQEWLKLVVVRAKGKKARVSHMMAEPLKDLSEVDISLKITGFLKGKKIKPGQVLISHPTENLTTRILSLPSVDHKEIKEMLELQAIKQTPYTRDEITTDFISLDRDDASGYSRVLLAISHRDVVGRFFRIAELSQVVTDRVSLSLEGVRSWYRWITDKDSEKAKEVTMLLDVDSASTELLVLKENKLVFSRNLSIGASHIKEQGTPMENEFLREVQRSVDSGEIELKDEKLQRIVITGALEPQKTLMPLLSGELNLPCEAIKSLDDLKDSVPEKVSEGVRDLPLSWVSVVGLALDPQISTINLIPEELSLRKGIEQRAKDLMLMGTLLLFAVTLASASAFLKIYEKGKYLETLTGEYETVRAESEDVERTVSKMKIAREQMSTGGSFLNVFHNIVEVIPNNIYLTYVQYNGPENNVTVRGISEEMSSVFQFLSTLESTKYLEFVKTRSVTKRKIDELDVAEFEIVANVVDGEA